MGCSCCTTFGKKLRASGLTCLALESKLNNLKFSVAVKRFSYSPFLIFCSIALSSENARIFFVALATFVNPESLQPTGGNGFAQTDESGEPIIGAPGSGARGSIRASALELANVDITSELLALIEAQRSFQSNAQSIQALNEASTSILQL